MQVSALSSNINYLKYKNLYQSPDNAEVKKEVTSNFISIYDNKFLSFKGSQLTPLTDLEYETAKKNLQSEIENAERKVGKHRWITLDDLNLDKINGIQKDIKVFEGLTMKEIAFILKSPTLLMNRCCPNRCAHCAYMATPYSDKTLDRMSINDFKSILSGISELKERFGPNISVCSSIGTFLDSDSMSIELTGDDGEVYDYIDCLDMIHDAGLMSPLFDTSGWNPQSEKLQKRAEKFVNYVMNPENKSKVRAVYISLNPYHSINAEAMDAKSHLHFIRGAKLENQYIERMANVLFTFSPIIDTNHAFGFLTRQIHRGEKGISTSIYSIQSKILKKLMATYKADLSGEQKVVKSQNDIDRYYKFYSSAITGCDEYSSGIRPLGRGEELFKKPESTSAQRTEVVLNNLETNNLGFCNTVINPNGSVLFCQEDIAVKTDLQLNFENKDKQVKPFAHQVAGYVYQVKNERLIKE